MQTTQQMVGKHGAPVLSFVVKAYQMRWPSEGYPVHVAYYTNWAGAYSTTGNLLMMSSRNPSKDNALDFEMAFHEAMHQWDDSMFVLVRNQARLIGKRVPANFTHAMIFYTAGAAVRSEIPGHIPYADAAGIWARGLAPFKEPLQLHWQAYLDGKLTRDEAIARMVVATATQQISPP